jgi:hypothetical protein
METEDEWQARIDEDNEKTYGPLYEPLAGCYLHCTKWRSFREIMSCGAIVPNTGQFKESYPQTPISYVYREKCVAVFDFVSQSRREILRQAINWRGFLYGFRPLSVVLELDPGWIEERLVRACDVIEPIVPGAMADRCPVVEAWIREQIPFSVVTSVRLLAGGHPVVLIDKPLTIERLDAARAELTERVKLTSRQQSPGGGLAMMVRLANRSLRRDRSR